MTTLDFYDQHPFLIKDGKQSKFTLGYDQKDKLQISNSKLVPNYRLYSENQNKINILNRSNQGSQELESLRIEVQDLKQKMKIVTGKFSKMKKEKEQLKKQNQILNEEVLQLQSHIRQMIPGFNNTSSSFPMPHEIVDKTQEFNKYDCEDVFFDILCPELNMKGCIYFYYTSYKRTKELIAHYFAHTEKCLREISCTKSLQGPVMNVLRKSYQATWKEMQFKAIPERSLKKICNEIQKNLKLGQNSNETQEEILKFLKRLAELMFIYYISDPPVTMNYKLIGTKVKFNSLIHEPLDGFIKNKEECYILLPSTHKKSLEGKAITKLYVLQKTYEFVS